MGLTPALSTSVERENDGGTRGILLSPAEVRLEMLARRGMGCIPHPTGDHKAPPNHTSSTLAPTEVDELFQVDAYWATMKHTQPHIIRPRP